jgi:hypothetical protein
MKACARLPLLTLLPLALVVTGCGPSSRSHAAAAATATPGAAAATLVASARPLRVEVDFVEGRRPSDRALDLLRQRLVERTDHPSVEVVLDDVLPATLAAVDEDAPAHLQTLDDVRRVAAACRDVAPEGVEVVHVLYLDGEADPSLGHDLVGAAWAPTEVVLFPDAILRGTGGAVRRAEDVEAWTLVHEAGHLLGLVGLGAPELVAHEDAYRRGHCAEPGCVVGWQANERATDFCPRCKDDLRALGGR